jgi:hypothetical protein
MVGTMITFAAGRARCGLSLAHPAPRRSSARLTRSSRRSLTCSADSDNRAWETATLSVDELEAWSQEVRPSGARPLS